jgi:hypothetical protein
MLAIMVRFKNVDSIIKNGLSFQSLSWSIKPEQNTTNMGAPLWTGDIVFGTNADTLLDDFWMCSIPTLFPRPCPTLDPTFPAIQSWPPSTTQW